MTSILSEMNSPTLDRSTRYESGLIASLIMDDNENVFPIQIEYVFHTKIGTTVVYTYTYKLCPDAKMCKKDILAFCEEQIKEAHSKVEFF